MDIYVGVIDKETEKRHVLHIRAMPNIQVASDLTAGGTASSELDWGVGASRDTLIALGSLLLGRGLPIRGTSVPLVEAFVDEVLVGLSAQSLWLLPRAEIDGWLKAYTARLEETVQ